MFKRKRMQGNYTKRKFQKKSYKRRGFYGSVSKKQFGPVARPELKHAVYNSQVPIVIEDTMITTQLFGAGIVQGLSDEGQRVGNRITQKFFSHNMLLNNPGNTGVVLRYVIWQPRDSSTTLNLNSVQQVKTKEYRLLKQGWINIPSAWSKVCRISYNLKNQVMTYVKDIDTNPVLQDRVYLSLVMTPGDKLNYQAITKFWYADA